MLERQHNGNLETPSSSTTLDMVDGEREEKDAPSLPPSTAHADMAAARPALQARATTKASNMTGQAATFKTRGDENDAARSPPFSTPRHYSWSTSDPTNHQWKRQCRDEFNSLPGCCPLPKPEYDKDILGYAIISFGFGELWILIAPVYRLFVHREDCAPLLSRSRWELDATSWVYGVAMILALIPFVVGSTLVIPHLYLYSPSFIMGFLGTLMLITELGSFVTIPIGINSQPRGTKLRPFIYYAAEDFIAVDGLQDREFRVRYNERYENNKAFRNMFRYLTWWWMLGVCVYIGSVSAVIWTLEFHYAFGLSLGVLFSYIAIWAAGSYVWVKVEIAREHRMFEESAAKEEV